MAYASSIAIDGPAGSGKSTLGAQLAARLGYAFVDAGALYRAITYEALRRAVRPGDEFAVTAMASGLMVDITTVTGQPAHIVVDGQELPLSLHTDAINQTVPIIAAYAEVRVIVRAIQGRIASREQIVFAGRDIGTVVLPDAALKLYLEVSLEERARRRFAARVKAYPDLTLASVQNELKERDLLDTTRAESPLRIADDAIIIHATTLNMDEVTETAMRYAVRSRAETPRKQP